MIPVEFLSQRLLQIHNLCLHVKTWADLRGDSSHWTSPHVVDIITPTQLRKTRQQAALTRSGFLPHLLCDMFVTAWVKNCSSSNFMSWSAGRPTEPMIMRMCVRNIQHPTCDFLSICPP